MMDNNQQSGGNGGGGNGAVIAVLVLVVVALAAWFGYKQGYLGGDAKEEPDININLPGTSPAN